MTEALARALWDGFLPDPAAPGRALSARLPDMAYPAALEALSALVRLALPVGDAPEAALARWPWSIDLAQLSVAGGAPLDTLERVVRAQNRRFGALAWAHWNRGGRDAALAVLDDLDPASDSNADDRATRAELRILSDLEAEPLPGPRGAHLALLATWRREGGAALARCVDVQTAALPAHPPLWAWLIDAFVTERDFGRAHRAMATLEQRNGADHPEVAAQRIRLALEAGNPAVARVLLDALPLADAPWRWDARRHVRHLRCLADEIAARQDADYAQLRSQTEAALRLFPGNEALIGLHWSARELTQDWDDLARDLAATGNPALAGGLTRLGLPEHAMTLLGDTADAPPLARLRAEALLRMGRLDAACAALGPLPQSAVARADQAWWRAEIALAARDIDAATAALAPALDACPSRMGLILSAARAAFLTGDFDAASRHLARFHGLKTAQLGHPPPPDLRDRIVQDAREAVAEGRGPEASPGLAAQALARATPRFRPDPGTTIPPRIAHYWEGPRRAPLERGLRAWGAQFAQRVFDAPAASAWLATHNPPLGALFDRLTQPATRADLFRMALIAHEGGVFADLDEYPRAPVTPWLHGARAVLVIEEGHGTLANNFLAAAPQMPLFARALDRIKARLNVVQTPYAWWDSGPAQLTLAGYAALQDPAECTGLRFLTQPEYDARVSTNLPFAHKRSPAHWR